MADVSRKFFRPVLVVVYATMCLGLTAHAQDEIVIQDIDGVVRAQGALEAAGDGKVVMQITDANGDPAPDGEVITLTPVAGGAAISASVIAGEVTFVGLGAGTYTVASTSVLTFASITVSSASVALVSAATTGGAIIPVVAGAGAIGIGVSAATINDQNNSTKKPVSPSR